MKNSEKKDFIRLLQGLAVAKQTAMVDGTLDVYWDVLRDLPLWAVQAAVRGLMVSPEGSYGRLPEVGLILAGAKAADCRRRNAKQSLLYDAWKAAWRAVTEHSENQTFLFDSPALQASIRAVGFDGTLHGAYAFGLTREKFGEVFRRYLDSPPTLEQASAIPALHSRPGICKIKSGLTGALEQRQSLVSTAERKRIAGGSR